MVVSAYVEVLKVLVETQVLTSILLYAIFLWPEVTELQAYFINVMGRQQEKERTGKENWVETN